jgi:phenylpyruvate tautomerase PptA (4-oxalocrotonate tautomerase family)
LKRKTKTRNQKRKENIMPTAYVDLPPGLGTEPKKKLMKEITDLIHHAYLIPDTRVLLREWSADQYSIDGEIGAAFRPIITFVVPPGLPIEGKRQLVRGAYSAIAEAYNLPRYDVPLPSGKVVSTNWVLGFFSEYPLEQAALDDLMAFENPMVLESMEAAMQKQKEEAR